MPHSNDDNVVLVSGYCLLRFVLVSLLPDAGDQPRASQMSIARSAHCFTMMLD
jgi:hypothetical protein